MDGNRDREQIFSMRDVKDRVEEMLEYDAQLSRQINLLEKLREEGRKVIEETQESGSDLPLQRGPRIVENFQVAPPLRGGMADQSRATINQSELEVESGSGGWTAVDRRGRERGNQVPLRTRNEVERPMANPMAESRITISYFLWKSIPMIISYAIFSTIWNSCEKNLSPYINVSLALFAVTDPLSENAPLNINFFMGTTSIGSPVSTKLSYNDFVMADICAPVSTRAFALTLSNCTSIMGVSSFSLKILLCSSLNSSSRSSIIFLVRIIFKCGILSFSLFCFGYFLSFCLF